MFNIACDCGGSELRYYSDGITNNQIVKRPAKYAVIPIDSPVIPEIGVKSEEMIIKRNDEEPVRILKGEAMDSYKGVVYSINHVDLKVDTPAVYYNIIYAITKTFLNSPINEILKIGVCLPPVEVFGGYATDFKEKLAGSYTVTFPYIPERTIQFDIKKEQILVQPEGVCVRSQIPEDQINCFKLLTLICDVGYRSFDLILMKGGKPIKALAPSYPHGGHNMESELQQVLSRNNISGSRDEIREAIITGSIQNKNITQVVNAVKQSFANILYNDIISMIGGLPDYTLQGIHSLVLMGRPFSKPEAFGVDDLSDILISKFPWMTAVHPNDLEAANVMGVYQSLKKWKSPLELQEN